MSNKLRPYSCPKCGNLEMDKEIASAGDQYLFIPESGEFYWQRTDSADVGTLHVSCVICGEDVTDIFSQYEEAGLVN